MEKKTVNRPTYISCRKIEMCVLVPTQRESGEIELKSNSFMDSKGFEWTPHYPPQLVCINPPDFDIPFRFVVWGNWYMQTFLIGYARESSFAYNSLYKYASRDMRIEHFTTATKPNMKWWERSGVIIFAPRTYLIRLASLSFNHNSYSDFQACHLVTYYY